MSLAVASTLINNNLRVVMAARAFSSAEISQIIDDPALLHTPARVGISEAAATEILYHGYRKGFSALFILNASLTVLAALVSAVLIKHRELAGDEVQAIEHLEDVLPVVPDLEMGRLAVKGPIP